MDKDQESLVQQDFEEEYLGYKDFLLSLGHKEKVVDEFILLMFMVWKAAHSKYHTSIPIKLPIVELPCWSEYDTTTQYKQAVESRLEGAGVKYK